MQQGRHSGRHEAHSPQGTLLHQAAKEFRVVAHFAVNEKISMTIVYFQDCGDFTEFYSCQFAVAHLIKHSRVALVLADSRVHTEV